MLSKKILRLATSGVVLAGALASVPGAAIAAQGSCAQPLSSGAGPVASDCLYILRSAVGTVSPPKPCITRPKHGTSTKASDALLCLSYSVGQAVDIDCPCGTPDVQSSVYTFDPSVDMPEATAAVRAKFVPTTYYGAFDQDRDASAGDWTLGWTVRLHGNSKVWHPASSGTLNGATPTAGGTCPAGTTANGTVNLATGMGFTGSMDVCDLPARFSTDGGALTLTNDNIYRVNSASTLIGDGDAGDHNFANSVHSTLAIEPGTLVIGNSGKAIIVTRGSQISALGTAADPIVMDSENSITAWVGGNADGGARRDWGGLVVTGSGTVNKCPDATFCDDTVEGLGFTVNFGGLDSNVNCGTIQYLVLANTGSFDIGGNDLNGLTVYACDANTTIDHVQSDRGGDDAFEFFGGTTVATHLVATGNFDDNYDTDLGFRGGVQFMVIQQNDGDKGFEWDNGCTSGNCASGDVGGDPGANGNSPRTLPNAANITVLMDPAAVGSAGDSPTGFGFRSSTGGNVWNVIQTNAHFSGIRTQAFGGIATATASQARASDKLSFNNLWMYNPLMTGTSGTTTLNSLRGADTNDANDLLAIFNLGSNNVLNTDPGLTTVPAVGKSIGYPAQ